MDRHGPSDELRLAILEHFIVDHGATIEAQDGAIRVSPADGGGPPIEGETLREVADGLLLAPHDIPHDDTEH